MRGLPPRIIRKMVNMRINTHDVCYVKTPKIVNVFKLI